MSKIFYATMCQGDSPNVLNDIKEAIDPILEFVHGIIVVVHDAPDGCELLRYLESVKGDGIIIRRPWVRRHDVSMNEIIYSGVMTNGDILVLSDLLEHVNPKFASTIKAEVVPFMKDLGDVDCLYYMGKPFIIKYNDYLLFAGSPHWYIARGVSTPFELSRICPDEDKVRKNMRPIKRPDPFGWVDHYVKYLLYPVGANSLLLGLEKNGDPKELFPKLEEKRLRFLDKMRELGYSNEWVYKGVICIDDVYSAMRDVEHLKQILPYINDLKELNDFYRYHILDDKTVIDDHLFTSMKKIGLDGQTV